MANPLKNIFAVSKKEFKTYFSTPVAYVIFGVFVIICSYFFVRLVEFFQRQSVQYMQFRAPHMLEKMNLNDMVLRPLFLNIDIFFLLMLPIITMRLIAEEKKSKTYELLMTTPISIWDIVIGKYLAAITVVFFMLLLTLPYPLLLHFLATPGSGIEWSPVLVSYLGIFLLGSSFVALGIFSSSVTENQVVAAILGFGLLLMFWVIGWAATEADTVTGQILKYVSILDHLDGFTKGVIKIKDVVFYLSFIFFFLFITHRWLESQRWRV